MQMEAEIGWRERPLDKHGTESARHCCATSARAPGNFSEKAMKVAVLQYDPRYLETDSNLDAVESMLGGIRADLIVLPELFATGYFFRSAGDLESVAEPVPEGKTVERLVRWAREHQTAVVAGLPELCAGKYFNSAVVVDPTGYRGRYRKLHLYYEENLLFAPGNVGLPVFDMMDGNGSAYRLGVMICFDWIYPEVARTLALEGADIIAHPSNLVRKDCPRAMPIRALENHVFTATANRIGRESKGDEQLEFIGQSLICGPNGDVLASLDRHQVGISMAELDAHASRDKRITAQNTLLADRRADAYVL